MSAFSSKRSGYTGPESRDLGVFCQKDLDSSKRSGYIGPETNVNSVLAATATFYITCFAANKWATKKTDKCRRNFLWAGDEEGHGGKSMVYWLKN